MIQRDVHLVDQCCANYKHLQSWCPFVVLLDANTVYPKPGLVKKIGGKDKIINHSPIISHVGAKCCQSPNSVVLQ